MALVDDASVCGLRSGVYLVAENFKYTNLFTSATKFATTKVKFQTKTRAVRKNV